MALGQNQKDYAEAAVREGVLLVDAPYLETGEVTLTLRDKRRALYFWNNGNFNDGESTAIMGRAYAEAIKDKEFDIFFGPAYKGIPIAVATTEKLASGYGMNRGWAFRRKEAKTVGEKGYWVGKKPWDNCRLLMGDDVITSAATKFTELKEIRKYAEHLGITVDVVGLQISLDREQTAIIEDEETGEKIQLDIGAADYFTDKTGIPCDRIFGVTDMMNYLYDAKAEDMNGIVVVDSRFMKAFEEYMKEFGVKAPDSP